MASEASIYPVQLPQSWLDALEQIRQRRSKLHYKPAALLVALDMLDESPQNVSGVIQFSAFSERFAALVGRFDPKGSDKGWEPFYHLATGGE